MPTDPIRVPAANPHIYTRDYVDVTIQILLVLLMLCPLVRADWTAAFERGKGLPWYEQVIDLTLREYARCLVRVADSTTHDDHPLFNALGYIIDSIFLVFAQVAVANADVCDIILDALLSPK